VLLLVPPLWGREQGAHRFLGAYRDDGAVPRVRARRRIRDRPRAWGILRRRAHSDSAVLAAPGELGPPVHRDRDGHRHPDVQGGPVHRHDPVGHDRPALAVRPHPAGGGPPPADGPPWLPPPPPPPPPPP